MLWRRREVTELPQPGEIALDGARGAVDPRRQLFNGPKRLRLIPALQEPKDMLTAGVGVGGFGVEDHRKLRPHEVSKSELSPVVVEDGIRNHHRRLMRCQQRTASRVRKVIVRATRVIYAVTPA